MLFVNAHNKFDSCNSIYAMVNALIQLEKYTCRQCQRRNTGYAFRYALEENDSLVFERADQNFWTLIVFFSASIWAIKKRLKNGLETS